MIRQLQLVCLLHDSREGLRFNIALQVDIIIAKSEISKPTMTVYHQHKLCRACILHQWLIKADGHYQSESIVHKDRNITITYYRRLDLCYDCQYSTSLDNRKMLMG